MRQPPLIHEYDPLSGFSISTLAHEYPRASQVVPHAHGSDQLIYASRGVMQVSSGSNLWVIPPHFGLWIPARTVHRIVNKKDPACRLHACPLYGHMPSQP
jgi:quercetin dioxygenase-like cupin family protein